MAYTSFFRDDEILDAAVQALAKAYTPGRSLQVWDAGCASGEEPYTLAMMLSRRLGPFFFRQVRILATDREESDYPQFEAKIRQGIYPATDLQWIPNSFRAEFVDPLPDGSGRMHEELRGAVDYLQHDLLSLEAPIQGASLVVCKNVILHLPAHRRAAVVDMFNQTLIPGGLLALDRHQELPEPCRDSFEPVHPDLALFRKVAEVPCGSSC